MLAQKRQTVLMCVAVVAMAALLMAGQGVQGQLAGPFGSSRPGSVLFEPTMSFIRQNIKLIESYVALMRSIFVGAYERPLITSTDIPPTATRVPSPKVPPMDLPQRDSN